MTRLFFTCALVFTIVSCTNTTELETGEIKTLKLLRDAINNSNSPKVFIDAKNLLSRKQIDAANIPILFVELETGQNGTLTLYPGLGLGQIWLGADGATLTLDRGILKASRGMGYDLMGATSAIPPWVQIKKNDAIYDREFSYLSGDNKIVRYTFECITSKSEKQATLTIWEVEFLVDKYEELCSHQSFRLKNTYFVDQKGIVRKSKQYHSESIGYIITERLDR